ncbi:hypothetical protein BJX70DRAFT_50054 [Aspergillus crustosus]
MTVTRSRFDATTRTKQKSIKSNACTASGRQHSSSASISASLGVMLPTDHHDQEKSILFLSLLHNITILPCSLPQRRLDLFRRFVIYLGFFFISLHFVSVCIAMMRTYRTDSINSLACFDLELKLQLRFGIIRI